MTLSQAVSALKQHGLHAEASRLKTFTNKNGNAGGWDGWVRKLGLARFIWGYNAANIRWRS
jgi:hypothetical protein